MHKSHQNIAQYLVSQRLLGTALWLGFCFLFYPHAQAQQSLTHITRSEAYAHAALTSPMQASPSPVALAIELALLQSPTGPFAQLNNEKNRESTAFWLNALQASGGSAAGNATVIALFIALDVVPHLFNPPGDWIHGAGPLLGLLLLIPAMTTPLFMHLWSPHAKAEHWLGSGIASLLSTLLHLGLMLGIGFTLNSMGLTDGLANTFYLLAPVGLISAVLLEGMGTAAGYQVASTWKKPPQPLPANKSASLITPWVSSGFEF
jgi:hypothetical protein